MTVSNVSQRRTYVLKRYALNNIHWCLLPPELFLKLCCLSLSRCCQQGCKGWFTKFFIFQLVCKLLFWRPHYTRIYARFRTIVCIKLSLCLHFQVCGRLFCRGCLWHSAMKLLRQAGDILFIMHIIKSVRLSCCAVIIMRNKRSRKIWEGVRNLCYGNTIRT